MRELKMPDKKHSEMIGEPYHWPRTISFTKDELPEIEKWEVGKKYTLTIDVEMTGLNESVNDKRGKRGEFTVTAVGPEEKDTEKEKRKELGRKVVGHM